MSDKQKPKMGAPAKEFDQDLADIICARIAEGESVREILRDDEIELSRPTFYKWLRASEDFANQYAQATNERAEMMFDEMFEIADDGQNDWTERQTKDGGTIEAVNHEHIARSKLRIDTRKWALARMMPKKFGDRVEHEHGGNLVIKLPQGAREA